MCLAGAAGCREECRSNASYCVGDERHFCEDTGNLVLHKRSLRTEDCAEKGLTCVEADKTYCGIGGFECDGAVKQVCVGDRIGQCGEGFTLPALMLDCGDFDQHCVETTSGSARCSFRADSCAPSSAPRCTDGEVLRCAEGAWERGARCFGECAADGAERCENAESPTRCTEGLWQATETCFAPCRCRAEADAAACACP